MITVMRLERFGAFIDRELEFGTVTLFVGPNESGKTTIVDALCDVLCKPRSNRRAGKRLALRYGTDRRVSAEFDGEPMTIPEDAFYDLFAIRSGELNLDVKPGSSWVETLKAELFTAGLDPKRMQAALGRRASNDGGSRHNRELRELREEQRQLAERRDLLEERVVAARAAESAVAGQRAERSRLAAELDGLTRTLDERQRQARHRLHHAEHREAERLLQRFEELAREPDAVPASSGEAAARLQELSEASDAAAQEVTRARAELEQARRQLQDTAGGAPAHAASAEGASGIATVVVLALLAGGVLAVLVLILGLPMLAAVTAGVAATAGTVAFAALIRQRAAGFASIREETDRAAERLRVRRERHDQLERELRGFLERYGAESKEQLLMQLGGARADESRRRDAEVELAAAARERGLRDLDTLRQMLREQLRDGPRTPEARVSEEPVGSTVDSYPTTDEERLRARAVELRERLEELDEKVGRDREKAAALSAGAAEMTELNTRIAAADRRIASLELDRRAAGIAASLFARIADESTAALDELSADIGSRYTAVSGSAAAQGAVFTVGSPQSSLTPAAELSSSVNLEALEEEPLIVDAYGVARPADQLSQGTRDAYSLAARLALAERAQRGAGLLIMDEPFHAMDTTRMRRALRLIARFQERTGWQLVVMTTDERVALAVSTQFAGAQVHRLAIRESSGPADF
jgi:DNA repair exonuclease SbcCD ATPase subunit